MTGQKGGSKQMARMQVGFWGAGFWGAPLDRLPAAGRSHMRALHRALQQRPVQRSQPLSGVTLLHKKLDRMDEQLSSLG